MKETSKIYVDIESLLDIRQAILSKLMNIDTLTTFINSDEYNFRNIDIFPINMLEYEKINSNKTLDLLPRSTVTYIVNVLRTKINNLEKRNVYYGETKTPEILLNIYPFNLPEEQIEIIQNSLFIKLDTNCIITIINKPIEELTPYFIKSSNIITCFIYNFSEWLNLYTDSLSTNKLTDTIFYFPSIYKIQDDNNELDKITKIGFKDIFNYLEFILSSTITISFLPIVFYSNIITSSILMDKINEELKNTKLGDNDVNISTEI